MIGDREGMERERVVEAVVARLRVAGDVEAAVEVPLARQVGLVAPALEQRRERDLAWPELDGRAFRDPALDAGPEGRAAGEHGRPRRRAERRGRVVGREAHPFAREAIEGGRLEGVVAVAAEIAVAEVVGDDEQDVRRPRPRRLRVRGELVRLAPHEEDEREAAPDRPSRDPQVRLSVTGGARPRTGSSRWLRPEEAPPGTC